MMEVENGTTWNNREQDDALASSDVAFESYLLITYICI